MSGLHAITTARAFEEQHGASEISKRNWQILWRSRTECLDAAKMLADFADSIFIAPPTRSRGTAVVARARGRWMRSGDRHRMNR